LSAVGYYEDAYDFGAFVNNVLWPLGRDGSFRYRRRILDLERDQPVVEPALSAPADAILVVDGSFLLRPELEPHWDHRIFVHTTFETALARGIVRDSPLLGGEEEVRHAYEVRYHAAARIYLDEVRPEECASVVVDNEDPLVPTLRATDTRK
jgi:uridine kinase